MNRFAELLDSLAYEPRRNAKIRLLAEYFGTTPDPDRGYALAAIAGTLTFAHAKAGLVRRLATERTDPVLFALSYDYVGDLSETVALMWEAAPADAAGPSMGHNRPPPSLAEVVETLDAALKPALPELVAGWLDGLDENGRWALLKLVTGNLRVGVSARLAKTALAHMAATACAQGSGTAATADAIEEVWHGLAPPYSDLFAWLEGRGGLPETHDPAPFRPPMLSHALDEADFGRLDPADFAAEWKWDGIRVQASAGADAGGRVIVRLFSRTGEDIAAAFPDVVQAIAEDPRCRGALDGELLVVRKGHVESFNTLQQRLNRKSVTARMRIDYPAHIRAYDLLADGEEDLRPLPFAERRTRLEAFVAGLATDRIDLSPLVPFGDWEALAAARAAPASHGAADDAEAIEGCMLKRLDSPYLPGRPKGHWYKWKRDPFLVDAVLMYAQRGHGRRSSLYSDFTFGVWRPAGAGRELVPVGKAYFGFTDEELKELDLFVRKHTLARFGPVREVEHTEETGLVLEVAFEGLQRSTRHKSGLAMRFPRIARIRRDKPPGEADGIELLEKLLD